MNTIKILENTGYKQKGLYRQNLNSDILQRACTYEGNYAIYGLSALESPENIYYIGSTSMLLNHRYNNHISTSKRNKTPKEKWIKSILENGDRLILTILKEGIQTYEGACACEISSIKEYIDAGVQLLNATTGGSGLAGFEHTEETKQKQSISNLGKPYIKGKPLDEISKFNLRKKYYKRKALRQRQIEQKC